MKQIPLIIICLIMTGYAFGQGTSKKEENFKKLSWLEGYWIRTNNKVDRTGAERWQKTSSEELRGFGFSLKGKDTLFVEKIKILTRANDMFYVADVPENQKPVYFKLTEITETGFVCENPEHDFPKKISYQLDGNKLKATISGDGKAVDYLFIKQ